MAQKILLTGASGFVGRFLKEDLSKQNYDVIVYNRHLDQPRDFAGIDIVIHLAAKVHDMGSPSYAEYHQGNVVLTKKLVERSLAADVGRFIFLSSIKVNGEGRDQAYFEVDVAQPSDFYGKSKWEAENLIRTSFLNSKTTFTIIRPPLIYGPGVGANFLKIMQFCKKNIPLPFGLVNNRRSFIFVRNLTQFIIFILNSTLAKNKTFLISDGHDLSTKDLIQKMSQAFNLRPHFIPVPMKFLKIFLSFVGKVGMYERLCGNLTLDFSVVQKELNWKSPYSVDDALKITCESIC